MTLNEFNQLTVADAITELHACCHCTAWAETVEKLRPFTAIEKLLYAAKTLWQQATETHILEAFSGHARIGDIEVLRSRYAGKATAEQGQVMQASEEVLKELHQLNIEYESRYGFIFIVCATGKSAEDMLALLKARINNGRAIELLNGAAAQGEITQLRLKKLFAESI
ncbi:MAG: 2-oxo-4-hydroxy-4-carboxy-5-ureidoimidazoline decarboxylase [Gammaproteobacteria bacterium]|nr:MAG: 2-oxo-4-hydroxy-4-carboxy-5-ureidoimidazoline decarboxylase [Gammaproteobacteria bacterium]